MLEAKDKGASALKKNKKNGLQKKVSGNLKKRLQKIFQANSKKKCLKFFSGDQQNFYHSKNCGVLEQRTAVADPENFGRGG